jgi:hypothetical protein
MGMGMGTPAVPWYDYSNHAEQCAWFGRSGTTILSTFPNHNHNNNGTLNHKYYNHHDHDHVDGKVGILPVAQSIATATTDDPTIPVEITIAITLAITYNSMVVNTHWDNHNHGSY